MKKIVNVRVNCLIYLKIAYTPSWFELIGPSIHIDSKGAFMLRKALGGAALAGAAGMLAAGVASPASAYDYDPDDFGGVNVLSNLCVGNWNGNLVDVLSLGTSDTHELCNGWDQNPDGVNVASNICALNWDWQGAILNGGHIAKDDLYTLCDWTAEEMEAKLGGYAE